MVVTLSIVASAILNEEDTQTQNLMKWLQA